MAKYTVGQRVRRIGNRGSERMAIVTKVTPKGYVRIDTDPARLIKPDGSWDGGCSGKGTMAMFRASAFWFRIEPVEE